MANRKITRTKCSHARNSQYENPKGGPSLQDVPGIKEYVNMLPEDERFFDKNGNEIPDESLKEPQLQARNRFIHSKWNGQGG